jgi:hypothetical protein
MSKKLDEEFVQYMLEVEQRYKEFNKHDRIRVENWVSASFIFADPLIVENIVSSDYQHGVEAESEPVHHAPSRLDPELAIGAALSERTPRRRVQWLAYTFEDHYPGKA